MQSSIMIDDDATVTKGNGLQLMLQELFFMVVEFVLLHWGPALITDCAISIGIVLFMQSHV